MDEVYGRGIRSLESFVDFLDYNSSFLCKIKSSRTFYYKKNLLRLEFYDCLSLGIKAGRSGDWLCYQRRMGAHCLDRCCSQLATTED